MTSDTFHQFQLFQPFPEVKAFVTTRKGGVSEAPFASLNVSFSVGDKKEDVIQNRTRIAESVGLTLSDCVIPQLVHGDKVATVTQEDRGRGMLNFEAAFPETDAMITNITRTCLWVTSADCVPILLFDKRLKVVGAAHAGWKGTLAEIGKRTVEAMQKQYGSQPADLIAGIGASVGKCCYEIPSNMAELFQSVWGEDVAECEGKQAKLDLQECNRRCLIDAGILAENIEVARICSSCNVETYFSYRKENGLTGRYVAGIFLQ